MFQINVFVICSLLTGYANSASTFDQRQTGDFNVQVDLKDLHIIAVMKGGKEEYVDYDYAYDYSEMTIKPQNGTTPKPANGTSTATSSTLIDTTTAATTLMAEHTTLHTKNNNSLETEVTLNAAINESATTVKVLNVVSTEASLTSTYTTTAIGNDTSTPIPGNTSSCKKGFVLNNRGDCELKLHGTGNALLKLVKLSQKLKLRRENRRNPDGSVST